MIKKIGRYTLTPFEDVLKEQLKNKEVRAAFYEEKERLRLVHKIKTLRKEKGLTQAQVAKRADMPQSVIARMESGEHDFSFRTLHAIARAFDKEIAFVEPTYKDGNRDSYRD